MLTYHSVAGHPRGQPRGAPDRLVRYGIWHRGLTRAVLAVLGVAMAANGPPRKLALAPELPVNEDRRQVDAGINLVRTQTVCLRGRRASLPASTSSKSVAPNYTYGRTPAKRRASGWHYPPGR